MKAESFEDNPLEIAFLTRLDSIKTLQEADILRRELADDIESIQTKLDNPVGVDSPDYQIWRCRARDAIAHKVRHMRLLRAKTNEIKRGIRTYVDDKEEFYYVARKLYAAFRVMKREGHVFPSWVDADVQTMAQWMDDLTYDFTEKEKTK
jgi:hypothetical protein